MRLTGYDLNGAASCASVFEDAALAARDQDAADYKPKIPTEVKKRHLLACFLIMAKGVTVLVPGKLFAVKMGAAPPSLLSQGVENERELQESKSSGRSDWINAPLREHVLKPTMERLRACGKTQPPETYLVDLARTPSLCGCPDGLHRGTAYDQCKHGKAVALIESRGQAAVKTAEDELVSYFQAQGCPSDRTELLETLYARLEAVKGAANAAESLPLVRRIVAPSAFRPQFQFGGLSTSVLRPGPVRHEVKLVSLSHAVTL